MDCWLRDHCVAWLLGILLLAANDFFRGRRDAAARLARLGLTLLLVIWRCYRGFPHHHCPISTALVLGIPGFQDLGGYLFTRVVAGVNCLAVFAIPAGIGTC